MKKHHFPFWLFPIFILYISACYQAPEPEDSSFTDASEGKEKSPYELLQEGILLLQEIKPKEALPPLVKADSLYSSFIDAQSDSLNKALYLQTRNKLGQCYTGLAKFEDAKKLLKENLQLGHAFFPKKHGEIAHTYFQLGRAYLSSQIKDTALIYAQQAAQILQDMGQEQSLSMAHKLTFIGQIHNNLRQMEQAEQYAKQAIALVEKLEPAASYELGNFYHKMGILQYSLQEREQAISFYDQAYNTMTAVFGEGHLIPSFSLFNKGGIYSIQHKVKKALEINLKVASIQEKAYSFPNINVGMLYGNLGHTYTDLQDNEEALYYYQRAYDHFLAIYDEKHPLIGQIRSDMAIAFQQLNQFHKALNMHRDNMQKMDKVWEDPSLMRYLTYKRMGVIFDKLQQYDSAYFYLQEAVRIQYNFSGEKDIFLAHTYNTLGYITANFGRIEEAISYYEKAIQIANNLGNPVPGILAHTYRNYSYTLNNYKNAPQEALAKIQLAIKALVPAFEYAQLEENPGPDLTVEVNDYDLWAMAINKVAALGNRFQQSNNINDYQDYMASLQWTYRLLDAHLKTMAQELSKTDLIARMEEAYLEQMLSTTMHAFELTQDTAVLNTSFNYLCKSKALLLSNAVARAQQATPQFKGWIKKEKELKYQLEDAERLLESLEQKEAKSAKSDSIRTLVFELNKAFKEHTNKLATEYPDYFQSQYNADIPSINEIQTLLPDANSTLIDYFVSEKLLFSFVLRKDTAYILKQSIDSSFQTNLTHFNQSLATSELALNRSDQEQARSFQEFVQQGHALYQKLLSPIISLHPQTENLIIIPNGQLNYTPFELLLRDSTPNNSYRNLPYAIQDFTFHYEYSTSFLTLNQADSITNELGAFAPAYPGDQLIALRGTADSSLLALSFPRLRDGITPLKYNQDEVKEIGSNLNGKVYTGFRTTKKQFLNDAPNYGVLHLAMHAFTNDTLPEYSHLVFAPENADSTSNRLYAYELYRMDLKAKLAVLSACETGAGKLQKGEGILSLSRAFKYAGCPNIVTSLWKANDQSTKDLMVHFYDNLKEKMGKAKALQQAKIKFLQEANQSKTHPFYWGGFILVGDNTPVYLSPSSNWLWYWVFGGIGVLAILLIGRSRFRKTTSS